MPTVGGRWPDLSDLRIYVFLPLMLGYIFPKVNARKVKICIFMNKFVYLRKEIFLNIKYECEGLFVGPLMKYSNTIIPAHEGSFMPCSLYIEC